MPRHPRFSPTPVIQHWRIGLVGFGAVGRSFVELLDAMRDELREDHGITTALGLVATRTRGAWVASDGAPPGGGLDTGEALRGAGWPPTGRRDDILLAVGAAPIDVLVEATTVDPRAGEPATSHLRAAFKRFAHGITANKGPIALFGPDLRAEAAAAGVGLRHESTVMDCLPVLSLRETVAPLGSIDDFAAVPNSTTSFILDAMAAGQSRAEAVAQAQAAGLAERDPSLDLDGWDAAFKAAILAQTLLGRDVRGRDVVRASLRDVGDDEPSAAMAAGFRTRMVARGSAAGGPVRVTLERVPLASTLGAVTGFSMALVVNTQHAGRIEVALADPTAEQAAYGMLVDLIAIDRATREGRIRPPGVR